MVEYIDEDLSALDALLEGMGFETVTDNELVEVNEDSRAILDLLCKECEEIEKEAELRRIDLIEGKAEELARSRARHENNWKMQDAASRHTATSNCSRNEFEGSDMWA